MSLSPLFIMVYNERTIDMAELNYDFRKRMLEVHKPDRRNYDIKPTDSQTQIDNDWSVVLPREFDKVLYNAAKDFEEYLFVSMNVPVKVARDFGGCAGKCVVLAIDDTLEENAYHIYINVDTIKVTGYDSRSAAQGLYHLEDLMNLAEAPILDHNDITRKPLYSPRMVHSGFGLDLYPDEHIRAIAHQGINALLVFVKGVDLTPFGYVDFNDLIYRASCYGVDVYAYSYMRSRLHPRDPKAEEFYEGLYGKLFERCPGFKGVIFVGESVEFPSRDSHTTGMLRLVNQGPDGYRKTPVTSEPPHFNPGWWPVFDLPEWVDLVKKVIRKRKPDADFVLWSYNWGGRPEADRLELIRNLPTDISVLVTFATDETFKHDGFVTRTYDYSLWFAGPGGYFKSEAAEAKKRGIRLYTMANTGGLTWDLGVIPYEPAPGQWIRRYEGMKKAHDDWGLCGVMESHHYGIYPSFISELAKWAFYEPVEDYMTILRRLAVRDFGEENADTVMEAYECFSEGLRHLVCSNHDQYGPQRIGPAYPLVLDEKEINIPTVFYAHFGGNIITRPIYVMPLGSESDFKRLEYEIAEDMICAEYYDRGAAMIEMLIDTLPERKRDDARRLAGLARFFANTAKTTVSVKQWHKRKYELKKLSAEDNPDRERIGVLKSEMRTIAEKEIANALDTVKYVEFDSRLGFEPSMEYIGDRAHIEWKIGITERAIKDLDNY